MAPANIAGFIVRSMNARRDQGQLAFRFYLAALGSSKDDERDAAAGVDAARVRLKATEEEKELAARAQEAMRGAPPPFLDFQVEVSGWLAFSRGNDFVPVILVIPL